MSVGEYRDENLFEDLLLADDHLAYLIDDSPRQLLGVPSPALMTWPPDVVAPTQAAVCTITRLPDRSMSISSFGYDPFEAFEVSTGSAFLGFTPVPVVSR